MKKILLFVAAMFAGVSMSAQLKGDMSISGNFLFDTGKTVATTKAGSTTSTDKTPQPLQFGAGVSFGYFVAENCEINLGLGYDLTRKWLNYADTDANKKHYDFTNGFSLTPGFKYYVSLVDDVFYYTPNVYLGLGFNFGKTHTSDTETTKKENLPFVFSAGLDVASFEIKPSYNVGITFSLGGIYYTNSTVKYEIGSGDNLIKFKSTESNFNISLDDFFTPKIGVKFYFF
ncbi:MAG: hypothetical protein IJB38_02525 [Bacteroidales bacterium]|nr:hypothetical protein [Bacteroidales bacterium]